MLALLAKKSRVTFRPKTCPRQTYPVRESAFRTDAELLWRLRLGLLLRSLLRLRWRRRLLAQNRTSSGAHLLDGYRTLQRRLIGGAQQSATIAGRIVDELPLIVVVLVVELADALVFACAYYSHDRASAKDLAGETAAAGLLSSGRLTSSRPGYGTGLSRAAAWTGGR